MKKLLIGLFLILSIVANATTYYVANAGSDAATGLIGAPWQTLTKVNSVSFSAGDIVLFNRGDTFRGYLYVPTSGNSSNRITFGAYGSGDLPIIMTALDKSDTGDWTNTTGNIWRSALLSSAHTDVGNLWYNNDAIAGVKRTTLGACVNQGDFYHGDSDDRVYMYSVGNPATFYSHIEIGGVQADECIKLYNKDYINVQDIHIKYSGNNGIILESGCDNVTLERLEISYCGGRYWSGGTRMGNGIQMWMSASNIIIRNNYIHDIYDAGISPQGQGALTYSNILMHNNIITNC